MFAAGLGPVANTAFGISTAIIAVPTGIKIFNWMGTLYGGDLRFDSPMLFAIGAIMMFVIGGLSGVTHSIVPSDYQQTDTYYIVAHFHYVLFGGARLRVLRRRCTTGGRRCSGGCSPSGWGKVAVLGACWSGST